MKVLVKLIVFTYHYYKTVPTSITLHLREKKTFLPDNSYILSICDVFVGLEPISVYVDSVLHAFFSQFLLLSILLV